MARNGRGAGPEGLSKEQRLRRRGDFERAYAAGTKVVRRPFVLFARRNGQEESRLGVTATRKIGNAVIRNRARRLVKEAFRKIKRLVPAGCDYVVVARPSLLAMTPAELQPLLLEAATQAAQGQAT